MQEHNCLNLRSLTFGKSVIVQTVTDGFYQLRREPVPPGATSPLGCEKIRINRLNGDWNLDKVTWVPGLIRTGMQLRIPSGERRETVTSPIKRIFA